VTQLAAARLALETYVRELVTHPAERLDLGKLRWLETEIERAVHNMEVRAPF